MREQNKINRSRNTNHSYFTTIMNKDTVVTVAYSYFLFSEVYENARNAFSSSNNP